QRSAHPSAVGPGRPREPPRASTRESSASHGRVWQGDQGAGGSGARSSTHDLIPRKSGARWPSLCSTQSVRARQRTSPLSLSDSRVRNIEQRTRGSEMRRHAAGREATQLVSLSSVALQSRRVSVLFALAAREIFSVLAAATATNENVASSM